MGVGGEEFNQSAYLQIYAWQSLIRWNIDCKIRKYLNGENMAKVVIYGYFGINHSPRNNSVGRYSLFCQ